MKLILSAILIFMLSGISLGQTPRKYHTHDPNLVEFWDNFRLISSVKVDSIQGTKVNLIFISKYEERAFSLEFGKDTVFTIKSTGTIVDRTYFNKHLDHKWGFFYCDECKQILNAFDLEEKWSNEK